MAFVRRRQLSSLAAAPCWKDALVEGIKAGRQRVPAVAASSEGQVILRRTLPNNLGILHVAASQPLSKETPGNGGLRLWQYDTLADAENEAARLGKGMEVKHSTFHTGFAGAKVVCAANKPPAQVPPPTPVPSRTQAFEPLSPSAPCIQLTALCVPRSGLPRRSRSCSTRQR